MLRPYQGGYVKRKQFETSQGDVKSISTGHLSSNSIIEKKE